MTMKYTASQIIRIYLGKSARELFRVIASEIVSANKDYKIKRRVSAVFKFAFLLPPSHVYLFNL